MANRGGALKPGSSFLSRPHLLACGPGIGFDRDLLPFTKGLESVKNIIPVSELISAKYVQALRSC